MQAITLADIYDARKRIRPFVMETPLMKSEKLSVAHDASIYLKLENLHETGSFKIRGATNKMLALTDEEKSRGVTTFSTGNHGLAVAYMAVKLGIKAVICISNRVPAAKVNQLTRLGAEVKKIGDNQDDAEAYAYELEKKEGLTFIPPFDDAEIISGQGTIGIELIEQLPRIDIAIIPVSGGGLFSGISVVLKQYNPSIKVVGVSMEKSAVMYESLLAKKPVILKEEDTLADSLLGGIGLENLYTFHMVQGYMDEYILLTEEEIGRGMAYMLDKHQFVVEGAAATSIAAIVSGKVQVEGKNVVSIITGKNVDTSVILNACEKYI